MALSQERKDQITAEVTAQMAGTLEATTFNVMTLAWAYRCHANEITPLVRRWVKDGLAIVAYKGCTGVMNYRPGRGPLASLLEAAQAGDAVALAAAADYLLEKGHAEDRPAAERRVRCLLGR
jgi:hypothetical protein